jgi:hypothetical protein
MKYRLSQQPIPVELSAEEVQQTLDFVAAMREDKTDNAVRDMMFDQGNTSEGINVIGHLGEQAVAKVLGLEADTTVRTHGDVGHDLYMGDTTIQVKTSTLDQLLFNAAHLFKSDVAILAQFKGADKQHAEEDPRFVIWGYVERKDFLDKHYRIDHGYGVRLAMDAGHLSPLEFLVEDYG